jgi:hypothetical protein
MSLPGTLNTSESNLEGVLNALQAEKQRRLKENRLAYYQPYPKQRDFHSAGTTHRERLLMAGNQLGKTLAGGFEVAMHATVAIPSGGKANASISPLWGGRVVSPAKSCGIPSKRY